MGKVTAEDEYRERWEYVRHVEEIRYRIIQWYFLVVGGVLAFGVGKAIDYAAGAEENVVAVLGEFAGAGALVLSLLAAYSVAIVALLIGQKAAYSTHTSYLKHLDREKASDRDGAVKKWPSTDAFPAALLAVRLVTAALFGLALFELDVWLGWFDGWLRVAGPLACGAGVFLGSGQAYKNVLGRDD